MSIYYIEAKGGSYQLNATNEVTKTLLGRVTDNPVEDEESVSDNYIHMPDVFNLTGILTDISSDGVDINGGRVSIPAGKFIEKISDIKRKRETFTFHFGEVIAPSLNCMFESIIITQDKTHGTNGGVNAFKFRAKFRQVIFAEKAKQTHERDVAYQDRFQKEEDSSQSTQTDELSKIGNGFRKQDFAKARALNEPINSALRPLHEGGD